MPAELTITLEQPVMVNEKQEADVPNNSQIKLASGSTLTNNDNPALEDYELINKEEPVLVDTEYESSSYFLPEKNFSDNSTSEGDGGFFIEDDAQDDGNDENDINYQDTDGGEKKTDYSVALKSQQEQQEGEACDKTALLSTSPSTMAGTSFPTRSILKADVEEEIPINTKKSKWKKLGAPDMEYVKMKRIESLNSIASSHNASTADLTSLIPNNNDPSPPQQQEQEPSPDTAEAPNPKVLEKCDSRVKFQHIVVREYQQTIGDNPSVGYGAPITLDWEYQESEPLDVDLYEVGRPAKRSLRQMHLNAYQRKNIFVHKYGFTEKEVKAAKKATNKVRSQREFSKMMHTSLQPLLKLEEMRESAVRKFRRYRRRNTIDTCECSAWIENRKKEKEQEEETTKKLEEETTLEDPASAAEVEMRRVQSAQSF